MGMIDVFRADLKTQLKIGFVDLTNVTRPGKTWRVGDKVRFDVQLKNNAPVPLHGIQGTVAPGPGVEFAFVPFNRDDLEADSGWVTVANNVEAEVKRDVFPNPPYHADLVAGVSLTATADLSSVELSDGTAFWTKILPG
jgi:hypothetical protein